MSSKILTPEEEAKKALKEAKRLEKLAKFEAKKAKQPPPASSKEVGNTPVFYDQKQVKSNTQEVVILNVPKGEKKDMTQPMFPSYHPKAVENGWYEWWLKQEFFKPEYQSNKGKGTFVIPVPPPNVTGHLHIGHALTIAVEDTLVRWKRMQGYSALFVPGCDHAGIATQAVVEKRLKKEMNITRHDIGREEFLNHVWKWKEENGDFIYSQFKRLGSSMDWDRVAFTLDQKRQVAVKEAFVTLHEQGLIYRDLRLVNYCSALNTVLSNEEVEKEQLIGHTMLSAHGHEHMYPFGLLTYFAYKVVGEESEIVVATTRPETILGDTAVAVNPKDEKYFSFQGKSLIHPFSGRVIPVVTDEEVDKSFGTGAVKITPAHDPTDYEIGKRHNLEMINILNDDNTINENGGSFQGLARFDARLKIVQELKALGLFRKEESHEMVLPRCSRSGDIIEYRLKPQWWLKCRKMGDRAMQVVNDGELEIHPSEMKRTYFNWLENIQDWCLSRQLWWGHRIPAYRVEVDGKDNDVWVSGRNEQEAMSKAKEMFPNAKSIILNQDEDVLDTWFSSAMWPFSTLGWPEQTSDLQQFYPNTLLETGRDIVFFWVIRMVMFGLHFMDKVPFSHVYFHPIVRDAHGKKMSKSKGNVIDPIDVMDGITLKDLHAKLYSGNLKREDIVLALEAQKNDFPNGIPECGSDALRFGLCACISPGTDINLNILRIEGYRKFCNKIWNACRFALMKLQSDFVPLENVPTPTNSINRWILSKLNQTIKNTTKSLEEYAFQPAATAVYSFWLYDLCDVYIEAIKPVLSSNESLETKNILYTCLDVGLKLLHPFMPYVTEELFQRLNRRPNDSTPSISVAEYPMERIDWDFNDKLIDLWYSGIQVARSMMNTYNVKSGAQIFLKVESDDLFEAFSEQESKLFIKGSQQVALLGSHDEIPLGCAVTVFNDQLKVFLLVKGVVDIEKELTNMKEKNERNAAALKVTLEQREQSWFNDATEEVKSANYQKARELEAEIDTLAKSVEQFELLKE